MAARAATRFLTASSATALDANLMSTGRFSLDQLMELAGLSVSQSVFRTHPPSTHPHVTILCGPGNNGGDGLVAARHLSHYRYTPRIYYPQTAKEDSIYSGLLQQCADLGIKVYGKGEWAAALEGADHVVDAVFGFSFKPPVRGDWGEVLAAMKGGKWGVTSVDVPSGWGVEEGPGEEEGKEWRPDVLVSLTAPKPCVRWLGKETRHFIGGRFVSPGVKEKFNLQWLPEYPGIDQVVEVDEKGDLLKK